MFYELLRCATLSLFDTKHVQHLRQTCFDHHVANRTAVNTCTQLSWHAVQTIVNRKTSKVTTWPNLNSIFVPFIRYFVNISAISSNVHTKLETNPRNGSLRVTVFTTGSRVGRWYRDKQHEHAKLRRFERFGCSFEMPKVACHMFACQTWVGISKLHKRMLTFGTNVAQMKNRPKMACQLWWIWVGTS